MRNPLTPPTDRRRNAQSRVRAGGLLRDALGVVAKDAGLIAANVHGDLIEGVGDGETRALGVGALRQGRNVRVGAGQRGDQALPNLAIAEAIIGLAFLLPPDLSDGLREGGLLARGGVGEGLCRLARGRDLRHATIGVVGCRRLQRGAVRAGAGLADGLPEKVLLRLLTIYYTHAYASYENGSI